MNGTKDFEELYNSLVEQIKNYSFKTKEELAIVLNNYKNQYNQYFNSEMEEKLYTLLEEVNKTENVTQLSQGINYNNLLIQLEGRIKKNEFQSKEKLVEYINKLKTNGIPYDILSAKKEKELLDLYDSLNPTEEASLDLSNYKGVNLEKKNFIVSTADDAILKTEHPSSEMPNEFKEVQNEITALGNDGLANADEAFNYMRNNQKEEINLMSIGDALNKDYIEKEILIKIRFFISNKYINPHEYKVNIQNGLFYNIETQETLEVRKNEQTNKYEIYKEGEKIYSEITNEESYELTNDMGEEKKPYEKKDNKVRKLIKPPELNNNAFVKSSLLLIISISIALLISLFLLKYK